MVPKPKELVAVKEKRWRKRGQDPLDPMEQGQAGKGQGRSEFDRSITGVNDRLADVVREKAKQQDAKMYGGMMEKARALRNNHPVSKFAQTKFFEFLTTGLAIVQIITVTMHVNCHSRNALCPHLDRYCGCSKVKTDHLRYSAAYLLPLFFLEWFLRLWVEGFEAFTRSVFLIDTLCTWIFSLLFPLISIAHPNISWLISLNVFRIVHIADSLTLVTRSQYVNIILRGFKASLRTLASSTILLTVTSYIFAVVGTGTLGHTNKSFFFDQSAFLRSESFDSLFSSMVTLTRFLLHDDALDVVEDIAVDIPLIYIYYFLFIATHTFVVMNLIIGVIVDTALEISTTDEEIKANINHARHLKMERELATIFSKLDKDGSGSVTFEEFLRAFDIKEMKFMLQALEVDEKDLISLFQSLDDDNVGTLSLNEFLYGMSRLQGEPRPKDFLAQMKLSEATYDLAKYLSIKILGGSGQPASGSAGKKEMLVAGESFKILGERIDNLRRKSRETGDIFRKMIHALDPKSKFIYHRTKSDNTNARTSKKKSVRATRRHTAISSRSKSRKALMANNASM